MPCEPAMPPMGGTTIRKRTTPLSGLPRPSEAVFGGRAPWSVVATGTLMACLGVDRGNFATWRCRGIGPVELPDTWFRPTTGQPRHYKISDVLSWLASRCGEPFDVEAAHRDHLIRILMPADLIWVRRLAETEGPVQGNVRFTQAGFQAYVASLAAG